MVTAAVVEDGVVVNITIAESVAYAESQGWIVSDSAKINDLWDGVSFSSPLITRAVPQRVSMRQARLALYKSGVLSQVEPTIEAMAEPARSEALIEWEYSQTVNRDWALVSALRQSLGLTSEQVDDLFILASKI